MTPLLPMLPPCWRSPVGRWADRLAKTTEWIAAILLAAVIAVNFLAVLARYGLGQPIGWSEEALRYAIVWAVYLVAGTTFRHGGQMTIDLIDLVPWPLARQLAALASLFATLTLAAVVVVLGLPFLFDTGQVSPSMRIPMWIPYASVVVGYGLIAVQAVAVHLAPPSAPAAETEAPR